MVCPRLWKVDNGMGICVAVHRTTRYQHNLAASSAEGTATTSELCYWSQLVQTNRFFACREHSFLLAIFDISSRCVSLWTSFVTITVLLNDLHYRDFVLYL